MDIEKISIDFGIPLLLHVGAFSQLSALLQAEE